MSDPGKTIQFQQFKGNTQVTTAGGVIVESRVSLTVNGKVWMSFMCTPTHLEALAVGFLFNEKIIESMDEVSNVHVCDTNDNIDVWLDKSVQEPVKWMRTSGCAGGITAVESIERPNSVGISEKLNLSVSQVKVLIQKLFQYQLSYREVGGVHTSILSDGENIFFSVEDVGRHNTLDKIAGLCLMNKVWPSKRILVTTGRISSEMIQKAARLGAGVLISLTSPTSISVEIAQAWGITLICYARADSFRVYSGESRIISG